MIEGLAPAFDTASALPAGSEALPLVAARFARPAVRSALPFALFCEDESRVRAWRRLEAKAALPMQGHAFASALSNTLLSGANIEIFSIPGPADLGALIALCRGPGYFGRRTMIGAHEVC